MPIENLKYPAARVCEQLRQEVAQNLPRYLSGHFRDLAVSQDWSIELNLKVNLAAFESLSSTYQDDAKSSIVVWNALSGLSPSTAIEGRLWTRMTHVEGLEYSRLRWIAGRTGDVAIKAIEDHFFADTRTGCRDDNAIGRLWWTAYVAYCALPHDHTNAISAIWKTADIRSNVIERPWITSRPALAGAIVRTILNRPEATATEAAFREFMKKVNAKGGGILFEAMPEQAVDAFVESCLAA